MNGRGTNRTAIAAPRPSPIAIAVAEPASTMVVSVCRIKSASKPTRSPRTITSRNRKPAGTTKPSATGTAQVASASQRRQPARSIGITNRGWRSEIMKRRSRRP